METNGIETSDERQGTGLPIGFVHALFMNTTQWADQVEALSDDFETVRSDRRGHGRTGSSNRPRYDVDLFSRDLDVLLERLDLDRPVRSGLSMGCCVAKAHAARHPCGRQRVDPR